jgi:uncharacterized protein YigA (DUF484 family)
MNGPDIPSINEEIACKFRKIEMRLTRRRSAVGLFEALLEDIQIEFHIPFIWLSLIHSPEMAELQKSLERSPLLHDRLKIIEQATFLEIVPSGVTPLLVSGDLKPYYRLLPPSRKYFIRSLAISPLTLRGRLIGSLNQGDPSLERYEPGMDTTLLMHLAQSVSDRLSQLLPIGSRLGTGTNHDS